MAFKKKPNMKRLERVIVDNRVNKLRLLASEIIVGIEKRTLKGLDVNLKSFKEYTQSYKKYKSREHGSSNPNLTVTGTMLGSMTDKKIKNGFRVYFSSNNERKKAAGNQKKRKFFGIDRKQRAWIKKRLGKL